MCFTNLTVYSSLCANQCYLTLLTFHSARGRSDYNTASAAVQWDRSKSWIPGNLHVLMIWNRKELHGQHFQQLLIVIQTTSTASSREASFLPQASQHSQLHADPKHSQPAAYKKFMAQFPSQTWQGQVPKAQTISSFHSHLMSHRTKQKEV